MSIRDLKARLTAEEHKLLVSLRERKPARNPPAGEPAFGERLADAVASNVGSWTFIAIQSVLLCLWIVANSIAWFMSWDPYPFILLNLVLSFQAAFTAPIIMMSQNRQSTIDRRNAQHDYDVNTKAELEIELLHQKVDLMREQELAVLVQMVKRLEDRLMLTEGGDGARNGKAGAAPERLLKRPAAGAAKPFAILTCWMRVPGLPGWQFRNRPRDRPDRSFSL